MNLWSIHQRPAARLDFSRAQGAHYAFGFNRLVAEPGRAPRMEALQASFATARMFAQATDFVTARRQLHHGAGLWPRAPKQCPAQVLVIAHGSLPALALIAEARNSDWNLVIEEGDFSGDFVVPLDARAPGRVEFVPTARLPLLWQERRNKEDSLATVWITFCDRPVQAGGCSLTVELSRGKYHLSVIDALLMVSGFDEVFVLGREIRRISVQHSLCDGDSRVSGETLMQYAREAISGLLELVECWPEEYLGMASWATRSERYRTRARNNKRAVVKSLLQYCQTNGLPLPAEVYRDFLLKLAAPNG